MVLDPPRRPRSGDHRPAGGRPDPRRVEWPAGSRTGRPTAPGPPPDTIHPVGAGRPDDPDAGSAHGWSAGRSSDPASSAVIGCRARPAIYCFNHLRWIDPFVLMATLPFRPRLMFFGPTRGGHERRQPQPAHELDGRDDPVPPRASTTCSRRRAGSMDDRGRSRRRDRGGGADPAVRDRTSDRSDEGAAYFALREGVPVVPIAIAGTSWLGFGRRDHGPDRRADPARPGRPNREGVDALTARCQAALGAMVADAARGRAPRAVRPVADRAVQRVARRQPRRGRGRRAGRGSPALPRMRRPRLSPTRRSLAYCRRLQPAQETPWRPAGLSADPKEYRARLAEQTDEQIDAWAAELMRDVAIRRGVRQVVGTSGRPPGSTRLVSNGCSLPAAVRRRSSGGTGMAA